MSRPAARPAWIAAAVLLLTAVALFPGVLGERVFYERDIQGFWYPQAEAFLRTVRAGGWPLWNRWQGFGQPMLADPGTGVLYPFSWLGLLLPLAAVYKLLVVTHLWLSGLGLARLARRALPPAAALLAAVLWMASGPLLSLVTMTQHFVSACWMPWVLLAFERLRVRPDARGALLLGAAAALQSLGGSADMCIMTALLALGRLIAWAAGSGGRRAPRLLAVVAHCAAASAWALSLAAALWMPALAQVLRSGRAHLDAQTSAYWSVHPVSLLDVGVVRLVSELPMVQPLRDVLLQGREPLYGTLYLGAVALGLAALALVADGRRAWPLGTAVLALALVALGRFTPAFGLVHAIPPFSLLRYPAKYLVPAGLAFALLAGTGYAALAREWSERDRRRARALARVAMVAAAVMAVAAAAAAVHPAPLLAMVEGPVAPGDAFRVLVAPSLWAVLRTVLLVAAMGALLGWRARVPTASGGILAAAAALAVVDVVSAGRGANALASPDLAAYRPALLTSLAPDARVWSWPSSATWLNRNLVRGPRGWERRWWFALGAQDALVPPQPARWGLRGSYDGDPTALAPAEQAELDALTARFAAEPFGLRLLQLGGVEAVVACEREELPPGFTEADRVASVFARPVRLMRVPAPLPRAYVAAGARGAATTDEALTWLASARFDPRREVVLPAGAAVPAPAPGGEASVALAEDRGDRVGLRVDAPWAGWLVLLDAWAPGWVATVDGVPAPVLRANLIFRAVPVPAGRHAVEMRYRPRSVQAGALLSALALASASAFTARMLLGRGGRATMWASR